MNSLFDIFSGIGILDCISFQKDESEHEVHLRSAKESTPCGRDNYVLSTLTSLDDEFTEGCCGMNMLFVYLRCIRSVIMEPFLDHRGG